tara:strand:- start:1372 stop:2214 length:843 start_codon:yes stop_codon:yes gene_type:complete
MKDYKKIIIIGAPRSGTNMLRDILTSFDGVDTWPCDEINYIWRHGNLFYPSDEFNESHATTYVKKYINQKFDLLQKKRNSKIIIEKTCANSLRIPFVDKVLPDARYIFIYRDGIDAISSAKKRWRAKLDLPYILKKVRYVPLSDLPYYAFNYIWSRIYLLFSKNKRLAFWGPSLRNMQSLLQNYTLNQICAIQWKKCTECSRQAFSKMPNSKFCNVKYEDFVNDPKNELKNILDFIGIYIDEDLIIKSVKDVSSSSINKGKGELGVSETKDLKDFLMKIP